MKLSILIKIKNLHQIVVEWNLLVKIRHILQKENLYLSSLTQVLEPYEEQG